MLDNKCFSISGRIRAKLNNLAREYLAWDLELVIFRVQRRGGVTVEVVG